jgi:hypothetical protein
MPLRQHIRSLFTGTLPRKVSLNGLGEFIEHRHGFWHGQAKLGANGQDMGILFKTGDELPGQREIAFWRRIMDGWPHLWPNALQALRRDLYFASPEEQTAFFAAIRPIGFVFHNLSPEEEQWEIDVEPDYSEHLLQVFMRGVGYDTYSQSG